MLVVKTRQYTIGIRRLTENVLPLATLHVVLRVFCTLTLTESDNPFDIFKLVISYVEAKQNVFFCWKSFTPSSLLHEVFQQTNIFSPDNIKRLLTNIWIILISDNGARRYTIICLFHCQFQVYYRFITVHFILTVNSTTKATHDIFL